MVTASVSRVLLTPAAVLYAYDAVSKLYPYIPPMSLWRAWEYAAYRRYTLQEPVLDVGCGDGRFFRLVWPNVHDVIGIDLNAGVAALAQRYGIYRGVLAAPAHAIPVKAGYFASAFANCSLEHMDNIEDVFCEISRVLRPDGRFVFSVVTDKISEWFTLDALARALCTEGHYRTPFTEWLEYHHLVNGLSIVQWCEVASRAGFQVTEYVPILPEMVARLFLLFDSIWHISDGSGEMGDHIYYYLSRMREFPSAFRHVLQGILMLEQDFSVGCGVVISARKAS